HWVENVDVATLAHGIGESQCGIAETAAGVDDTVTRLRRNPNPVTLKIVLPVKESPGCILFPALDHDLVPVAGHVIDRERAEQPDVARLFHCPLCRNRYLTAILGIVERQAYVQMSKQPKQQQLVVEDSRRFVREQHACLMELSYVLQKKGEVRRVPAGKKCIWGNPNETLGGEIVLFEPVH